MSQEDAPRRGGMRAVGASLPAATKGAVARRGFAEARLLEISTQLRPTLADNLPAVRWLGERCLQINGLYRHGFLIAPAMLDVVLELMQVGHTGHSALAKHFDLRIERPALA